MSIMQKLIN